MEEKSMSSLKNYLSNVIRIRSKLKPLYEDLEYLKMKSLCYPGVAYDREGTSQSNPYKDNFSYWLDKIDVVEKKIDYIEKELAHFERFKALLTPNEVIVLEKHLMVGYPPRIVIERLNIKRARFYEVKSSLERKFQLINQK